MCAVTEQQNMPRWVTSASNALSSENRLKQPPRNSKTLCVVLTAVTNPALHHNQGQRKLDQPWSRLTTTTFPSICFGLAALESKSKEHEPWSQSPVSPGSPHVRPRCKFRRTPPDLFRPKHASGRVCHRCLGRLPDVHMCFLQRSPSNTPCGRLIWACV